MDLNFLDSTSEVTPLLVKLYDQQRQHAKGGRKKPSSCGELAAGVVELLRMELTPREHELVSDILIGFIRQAEKDLKLAVSERIAVMEGVPLRLALQIANEEIDVARPMLSQSSVLSDVDLVYIIKSKGSEYWQAIATRKELSDQVMETLADTKDIDTAITLAENENIKLTDHTLGVLSDLAQGQDRLAQPLLRRDEVTQEMAKALYEYVGEALKASILEQYPVLSEELANVVDDVVMELSEASNPDHEFLPSESQIDAAKRHAERGTLSMPMMIDTLKRGQHAMFVAQLGVYSGLNPKVVFEVLGQKSGQGLAIIAKALDMLKPDFVSIYLLTSRFRGVQKVADIKDINRAVEYYNHVSPQVAQAIMNDSMKK